MKQHQDEEVEKLDREGYRSSSSSPSPPSSHPKFGGKCPRKQYVERRPGTLLDWEGNGNAAGGDDSSSSSSSSDSSSSDEEDGSGSSSSSSSFEDDVDKANVRAVQPQRRQRAAAPVVAARSSEDEVARLKNVVSDLTNNMNTLTEAMTEQLRIQNQTKAKQQQQQQRRRELQQQRRKQQKEAGLQQRQQPQGAPKAATSSAQRQQQQQQQQQHRPTSVSASSSAVASSKPHQQSRSGSVSPKSVASSPAVSPKPVASSPVASPKSAAALKAGSPSTVSPLAVSSSQTAVSKSSSPVTVVAAKKPASPSPAVPKESVLQMMQKGGVHSPQPAQKKQCVDDDGKKKAIRVDIVGNKPVITIVPKLDDQKKKSDKEEEKKEEEKKEEKKEEEKKEEKKKEEEPRQKRSHAEINKEEAMGEKGEEAKPDGRQNESDSDDRKPPKKKHKHHHHHHRRDQKRKDSKRSGTDDESEVEDEDEEEEEVPKKKKADMPPPPLPSSPQPQPQTRRRRVAPSTTVSEVKQRLKKLDKKKRRTLAIVKYYTDTSTKLRACGNCAKCLAPTCGICTNCKRNANMKADSLRKSKKRCTALTCERVTKKDIAEQRLLLTGESYHIRPELSQLEKARIKWAKTACRYCNDERGAFARRMRDNKLQQIVFTIKNFRKELEAAGEVSAKLVCKFLDKGKVKYYKSEDEDETFNMGEEGDEGMVGGESMDGEEDE